MDSEPAGELRPHIQNMIDGIREELRPYGWSIDVMSKGGMLSIELRNPLSPAHLTFSTKMIEPETFHAALVNYMNTEPELVATRSVPAIRSRRKALGILRGGAGRSGWTPSVYRRVIDVLHEARFITNQEADWLEKVGPAKLS